MAVDSIYRFYGLQFTGTQFSGPALLGGVINSSVAANAQVIQDYTDGNPHPTRTTIQAFQEELSFTTFNIDTALDLIGTIAQCIEDGSAIELYYAKFSEWQQRPAFRIRSQKDYHQSVGGHRWSDSRWIAQLRPSRRRPVFVHDQAEIGRNQLADLDY